MLQKFESYLAVCVTLLIVCALITPILCTSAHAHLVSSDTVTSKIAVEKKAQSSKSTTETPPAGHPSDHCCFAHHCGSILVPSPLADGLPTLQTGMVVLIATQDQIASGPFLHGLDRPPKHLV